MPSELKATPIANCEGGLDFSQNVISKVQGISGFATQLINYEPSIQGGYRRINGYAKYSATIVPGSGPVVGVGVYNGGVLAVRANVGATAEDIYFGTGTTWTKINGATVLGPAARYRFQRYNYNGTDKIVIVNGHDHANTWDGSTFTVLNGANSPNDAKYVTSYKNHMFFAGYTNGGGKAAVTFSAPLNETDFAPANGAGEFMVDDEIVGLKGFRDALYILCKHSIHKMVGSSSADFAVEPVTRNLGCVAPDSIQEIGGDLVFLAPDGIRTVAGTNKIGDVQLESISRQIHTLVSSTNISALPTSASIVSMTIRSKSQYRLFFPTDSVATTDALGVIGGIRKNSQGVIGWEWGQLQGIKPYCLDSLYIDDQEFMFHGGYDGYVYLHDSGPSFDGSPVRHMYRTPDFDLGDSAIRKVIHKVLNFIRLEGPVTLQLNVFYDRGNVAYAQPPAIDLVFAGGDASIYGVSTTVYSDTTYGQMQIPFDRTAVRGSGFLIALSYSGQSTNDPHTIEGFALEYKELARR